MRLAGPTPEDTRMQRLSPCLYTRLDPPSVMKCCAHKAPLKLARVCLRVRLGPAAMLVRCCKSKGSWRCANEFPAETQTYRGKTVQVKLCPHHRSKSRSWNKTEKGVQARQKYEKSEKGQTANRKSVAKFQTTEAGKEIVARYNASAKGKMSAKRRYTNLMSDPGKKMMRALANRAQKMMRRDGTESASFKKISGMSKLEFCAHMESTFVGTMSWENFGTGTGKWNVGHRIAVSMFDFNDMNEVLKCWNRNNLFAQWSIENRDLSVKLPDNLESLRDLWPAGWRGVLPVGQRRIEIEKAARNGQRSHFVDLMPSDSESGSECD